MALTPKQQRFCEEYLIDRNGTQAAIRAGYSVNTAESQASRLLINAKVKDFINKQVGKMSERTGIDADYVLNTIKDTVERCRQAEPVLDRKGDPVIVETETGEEVPAYKFDSGGVLKGCELLGKHLKLFTEKVETTGADGGPIESKWTVEVIKPGEA